MISGTGMPAWHESAGILLSRMRNVLIAEGMSRDAAAGLLYFRIINAAMIEQVR